MLLQSQATKAQGSLDKCFDSPEPSLLAFFEYIDEDSGLNLHLAPLDNQHGHLKEAFVHM